MARYHGKDGAAPFVADLVDIGMAHTAVEYLYLHIVCAGFASVESKRSERTCGILCCEGFGCYHDFMVFNFETYPQLRKLFEEINAPVKKTDMSFSVQHLPSGLEYSCSGINGLFAQRKNIFNIKYIKMLGQISRFNKISVWVFTDQRRMLFK